MKRLVPWAILALSLLSVAAPVFRPVQPSGGFNLAEFSRLPVFMDGRAQPIGSAARSALLKIRGTTVVPLEEGRTLDPTEWLLEVLSNPYVADQRAIFPIRDPALRRELQTAAAAAPPPTHYSFKQVASRLEEIKNRAERINELRPEDRSATERELMTLLDALIVYQRLKNSLQPNTFLQLQRGGKPLNYDLAAGVSRTVAAGAKALKAREHGEEFDRNTLTAMMDFLQPYEMVARVGLLLSIPPANPAGSPDGWENMGTTLRASVLSGDIRPPVAYWAAIITAFSERAPAPFNREVSEYRAWLTENGMQSALRTSAFEGFYTRLQPSTRAAAVYLISFLVGCAFWVTRSTTLYRSALMLCVLALALHTTDLVIRGILVGRAPLTNGYSSTVFAAWGAAVLGIAIEASRRNGIGVNTAALAGVLGLVVGRVLTPSGDAMEAIRATLNSSLWLTGHVGLIALGYATVFLSGSVAAAYILLGVSTRSVSPATAGEMDRLVYRLLCAAALFIAAGVMAGGFWADRVWGRFWGWDPKENGALLIILWTGISLHARWHRLAEVRARMLLAVGGTVIATISWIGMNMMGVGLHSYGFMPRKFGWLALFLVSQLVVLGVGLLPLPYWRSSRERRSESPLDGSATLTCFVSPIRTTGPGQCG
ncbi:MAG TPA: cytochrome c biogenesis protein CcsA [Vicinamibacterales bacterium]|nr:cytochrome c biogenesis protein CcsA [Vicinamibacterales bacterium]